MFLMNNFRNAYVKQLNSKFSTFIDLSEEVKTALFEKKPVLALESTIISHGMPFPINLECAKNVEGVIRKQGVVPAPIAVLGGRIKVGLSNEQLEYLATPENNIVKASRRDLPYLINKKLDGGTTVSATMIAAHAVGLKVFVTGGIGGVHRGAEETLDISADLTELGRTPIMVVCSGLKSILDIPKSLEYLETEGVCVVTYGNNREFPSFYSRTSGAKAPYFIKNPTEAAQLLDILVSLQLNSGILVGVPIPEEHSIDYHIMEVKIKEALAEAKKKDIQGKNVTPFLLDKIRILTEGKSLQSNVALIEHNALIGAQIAAAYENEQARKSLAMKDGFLKEMVSPEKHPVVVGGAVLDCVVKLNVETEMDGRTVEGRIEECPGGVGRNMGDALGKLGTFPAFLCLLGRDQYASLILQSLSHIDRRGIQQVDARTANFVVLVDHKGECLLCAGTTAVHSLMDLKMIEEHQEVIEESSILVLDANIPKEPMNRILEIATHNNIPCWFEPTDVSKCNRLFSTELWTSIAVMSPNIHELRTMASYFGVHLNEEFNITNVDELLKQVVFLAKPLAEKITLMVTLGKLGIVIISKRDIGCHVFANPKEESPLSVRYYPANEITDFVNASGAGDCGASGFIVAALKGHKEPECVAVSQLASKHSLFAKSPVPDSFPDLLENVQPASYHNVFIS